MRVRDHVPVGFDATYARHGRLRIVRRATAMMLFEGRAATARGQFLNPLVRIDLDLVERLGRRRAPDRPVFIVGMGRSGTTLALRIVSVVRSVAPLNEPSLLHLTANPTSDVTGQFAPVGALHADAGQFSAHARDRLAARVAGVCFALGARRYVERNPDQLFRIDWLRAAMPDARFVAVVRRPEAVIASAVRFERRHGAEGVGWWGRDDARWRAITAELARRNHGLADAAGQLGAGAFTDRALVEWVLSAQTIIERRDDLAVTALDRLRRQPRHEAGRLLRAADLSGGERAIDYAGETIEVESGEPPDLTALVDSPQLVGLARGLWAELSDLAARPVDG